MKGWAGSRLLPSLATPRHLDPPPLPHSCSPSPRFTAPLPSPSADARDFVSGLLQRDEALRPTAEQALLHPWLQPEERQPEGGDVPLGATIVQRLQRFGTYGRLRKAALRTVANQVPQVREGSASREPSCFLVVLLCSEGLLHSLARCGTQPPSLCRTWRSTAGLDACERDAGPVSGAGPSGQRARALHPPAAAAGGAAGEQAGSLAGMGGVSWAPASRVRLERALP